MLLKAKIAVAALAATAAAGGGTALIVHAHDQHGRCESAAAHAGHLAQSGPDHGKAAREAARAACGRPEPGSSDSPDASPRAGAGDFTTSPRNAKSGRP